MRIETEIATLRDTNLSRGVRWQKHDMLFLTPIILPAQIQTHYMSCWCQGFRCPVIEKLNVRQIEIC